MPKTLRQRKKFANRQGFSAQRRIQSHFDPVKVAFSFVARGLR
jgi:hypothetical protein